jgi:NTE family protein
MEKTFSVGITLSGGGAKGIAHIGVLKALLDHGIRPEIISGTSAGSIVGALYAAGRSIEDMERFVNDSSLIKIFRVVGIPGAGLVKLSYVKDRLQEFIPEDRFETLKMPFYVCATNLNLGKAVMFDSGPLFDVVVASCSVPWLFKPQIIQNQLFADGGLTNNMPAEPVRKRCHILIGSNVKPKVEMHDNPALDSFMGITQRVVDLSLWTNTKPNVKMCDVYIAPPKIHDFGFFDIRKTAALCAIGYEATVAEIPKLRALLAQHEQPSASAQ